MWELWIDTGGTFTDCMGRDEHGEVHRAKVLSSAKVRGICATVKAENRFAVRHDWALPRNFFAGCELRALAAADETSMCIAYDPDQGEIEVEGRLGKGWESGLTFEIETSVEAPVLAAHWVTGTPLRDRLPPIALRLATTRGTNALLERRGSAPVFLVTRGFGDLLEINTQQRPDLFALSIDKPDPLYGMVIEVPERLAASGDVLDDLDRSSIQGAIEDALSRGFRTAAVALLHSHRNAKHEAMLSAELLSQGFSHVSCSAEVARRIKIVPRAQTTVVNAYLSEVIEGYLESIRANLSRGTFHVLTSAGGLVEAARFQPKDSLLSGPAGGVVGAASVALESGFERSIAFDMGGTSTDVSRFDGNFDYTFETTVADVHLLTPSLAIETVAAGGGSICRFDGTQLKVGPQSAGADPGPACYGARGPLTLTDVNLLLGRIDPRGFQIPIDPTAARDAANEVVAQVAGAAENGVDWEVVLHGFLAIANERMAAAIRRISIREGYDPADFALVAFGGAGGQHACELAEILGIATVLIPRDASLLSAAGLGRARIERFAERQVLQRLDAVESKLEGWFADLQAEAVEALIAEGVDSAEAEVQRRLIFARLVGQETSIEVEYLSGNSVEEAFERGYEQDYGYRAGAVDIEIESIRLIASSREPDRLTPAPASTFFSVEPVGKQSAFFVDRWEDIDCFDREELAPGATLVGPALVLERHSVTVVPRVWKGEVDAYETLVLRRLDRSRAEQ